MSTTEIVSTGKYKFKITRNIQTYRDEILIHTYKIGGDFADCVNISYLYKHNKPYKAKIPHLLYEPECAVGMFLEKGTEIMIKTGIRYAYKDVPAISVFEFEDDSHIDCVEKNMTTNPPRKQRKPLNLAFFYIAYHSKTWYEDRFNAKMLDPEKYKTYRKSLNFLTDPKQKLPFLEFLHLIGASLDSVDRIVQIEKYYNPSKTYREFFDLIPKSKRCDLLYGWLNTFMNNYITFDDKGWFINVNEMNNQAGGVLPKNFRIFSYRKMSCF